MIFKNDSNENDNIDYWIEDLQSIKVDESILLDLNGWLSDQYLGSVMQILYVEKLQTLGYEQHAYAIIGKKMYMCQKMFSTHIHKQRSLDISKNPHVNS
jgi:hypothetical protein